MVSGLGFTARTIRLINSLNSLNPGNLVRANQTSSSRSEKNVSVNCFTGNQDVRLVCVGLEIPVVGQLAGYLRKAPAIDKTRFSVIQNPGCNLHRVDHWIAQDCSIFGPYVFEGFV